MTRTTGARIWAMATRARPADQRRSSSRRSYSPSITSRSRSLSPGPWPGPAS
ncbi:hypothetical protein SPICUR_04220 [Spiribacter curvatus]|uniref:Uncharacterized protein n=1 Tax=Spiribacter curvatus TaxID=1335757 RepID=U5T489_9GAMM|nr:hypothetical protein SPICUR_04220 [Spiribacter curvatus]